MPLTVAQYEKKLKVPAVCELLPLRESSMALWSGRTAHSLPG
jgi:hypothetical protein